MDRELNSKIINRRRLRVALIATSITILLTMLFIWGPVLIRPSVARVSIRTDRVARGNVESIITATGNVMPEFELVIPAPFNTRVLKILKRPGAVLVKGEPILQLDLEQAALTIEKLNQTIELKKGQQSRSRLTLEGVLIDSQSKLQIKKLDFKTAQTTVTRNKILLEKGLLSEERMNEFIIQAEKASVEIKQLEAAALNSEASAKAEIAGIDTEIKSLTKERDEAARVMELGTTKSDRNGVLTFVVNEEGASVTQGTVLARIADLNSFRVEATISDVHAGKLSTGQSAKVKINDELYIDGNIAQINPAVKDGAISIVITLQDKSNSNLRSNLRVDAFIETARKINTLKIKRGQFANGNGISDVFVIRGDNAFKTSVKFGIVGADHLEILEGLSQGDDVIISDMNEYIHLKQIGLK